MRAGFADGRVARQQKRSLRYAPVFKAVCDHLTIKRDAPLPARRLVGYDRHFKQARATLFHSFASG
jgi:hypothetical protein